MFESEREEGRADRLVVGNPVGREIRDSEFIEIDDYTIRLSDSVALRISADTRPKKWKTADLQKGLRLCYKGIETVGEGAGLCVPVLLYSSGMYFPGSSKVYVSRQRDFAIRKEFIIDRMPGRKIGNTRLGNRALLGFWRRLGDLYMKHRRWRFIIRMNISRRIGVRTNFFKVNPVGRVIVTYHIDGDCILTEVDISHVRRNGLQKLFVLNEQGTRFFSKFSDSDGMELSDKRIGAWETVDADSASITDSNGRLGFRLSQKEDTILHRGGEYMERSQDWIGLDYEVDPKHDIFEYGIKKATA